MHHCSRNNYLKRCWSLSLSWSMRASLSWKLALNFSSPSMKKLFLPNRSTPSMPTPKPLSVSLPMYLKSVTKITIFFVPSIISKNWPWSLIYSARITIVKSTPITSKKNLCLLTLWSLLSHLTIPHTWSNSHHMHIGTSSICMRSVAWKTSGFMCRKSVLRPSDLSLPYQSMQLMIQEINCFTHVTSTRTCWYSWV